MQAAGKCYRYGSSGDLFSCSLSVVVVVVVVDVVVIVVVVVVADADAVVVVVMVVLEVRVRVVDVVAVAGGAAVFAAVGELGIDGDDRSGFHEVLQAPMTWVVCPLPRSPCSY